MELNHLWELHGLVLYVYELSLPVLVDGKGDELLNAEPQGEWLVTYVYLAARSAFSWRWFGHHWKFSTHLFIIVLWNVHELLHFLLIIVFLHIHLLIDKALVLDSETNIVNLDVHIVQNLYHQSVQVTAFVVFHFHFHRLLYHVLNVLLYE